MPELAEIWLMSECINTLKDHELTTNFSRFKNLSTQDLPKKFFISSDSRGKELKITLRSIEKSINLFFSMGMSGNIAIENETRNNTRLSFIVNDKTFLNLNDTRKFAKVKIKDDWNEDRSPCPVKEHEAFISHLQSSLHDKILSKLTIGEALLQQQYFNGIGNYLRAEILFRAKIAPWSNALETLSDSKKFKLIVSLCKKLPLEVLELGGGQIKDWKSPTGKDPQLFADWQQVYRKGKSYEEKRTKRTMWYDPSLECPIKDQ